jgi:type II secretory pathway component PulF
MSEKNNFEKEFFIFKKVSLLDKFNFYEYLSIMLDGWVTIVWALESVIPKLKNPFFKQRVKDLIIYISSWDSLNKAMKKLPDVFSQSESSIVEAWEKSWTLYDSLSSMAIEFKKLHELKSNIKSSLTYPFIIILFLIWAVVVVMTYVVPSLVPLIEEAWVEKPFATTALIATSNFFVNNYIFLILVLIFSWFLFYSFSMSENWKRMIDSTLLKLPLVGDVYRNYIVASSASILWNLLNSWVQIMKALTLVWKSTNNLVYEDLFSDISVKVWSWKKLVDSIVETDPDNKYFPSDFVQLLTVWERTATIHLVCKKLNEQYTREVNYSLANLTKWIEPIAILVAWVFVLWFAFAIFWAILKLTQTIW